MGTYDASQSADERTREYLARWTEGDPIATVDVEGQLCYEYADGSIRCNRGGGMWVKLAKAERDGIAELPRVSTMNKADAARVLAAAKAANANAKYLS